MEKVFDITSNLYIKLTPTIYTLPDDALLWILMFASLWFSSQSISCLHLVWENVLLITLVKGIMQEQEN